MSRYRPPRPQSSPYITPDGAQALRRELDELWRVKRPAITKSVAEAAAQGDRSENAEYIYGKKQLAEIDRRIRFLRKRLAALKVVETTPSDTTKVYFGAWFEVRSAEGGRKEYRIVGPDEAGFEQAYVSMDSPLGRAVLGKRVGDTFVVRTPAGPERYELLAARYR